MKLVLALALAALAICGFSQDEWQPLFDGESLEGWQVKSGFATYKVEDGAIVGRTAKGSPNTFLCTQKTYDDFELEFEVKVDDALNSGVQIRSALKDAEKDGSYGGRVNGPQVEIEAGPGQAGFIYGEATSRGWISDEPKSEDPEVNQHDHFKNGQWNKYRVVADGQSIKVWINGQLIEELEDEDIYKTHPKGVIGLQVHGIGSDQDPCEVRWKNIRIRPLQK